MAGDNHYVSKRAITRSIVEGIPAKALCGVTLMPSSQGANAIPGHEVAHRNYDTCPECELFFNALPEDAEAKVDADAPAGD